MTIELTAKFECAAKRATTWTHASVREMLQAVVNTHPGARVDWEPGDEAWARILEAEEDRIIAFVCAKFPLGFIRGEGRPTVDPQAFVWISVSSTDAADFSVSPELLEHVFGRSVSRNINYDEVSADDIWWATVS